MNEAALMMWVRSVETRMKEKDPASQVRYMLSPGQWRAAINHTSPHNSYLMGTRTNTMVVGACLAEFMEHVNKWVEDYKYPEKEEPKEPGWVEVAMNDACTQIERKASKQAASKHYGTWVDWNNAFNKNPRNYAKGGK